MIGSSALLSCQLLAAAILTSLTAPRPQTDVDAFFLGDALAALAGDPTLVSGLSDRQFDGSAPVKGPEAFLSYCDDPEAVCQSTGFMYLRPHPVVVAELEAFLGALQAREPTPV